MMDGRVDREGLGRAEAANLLAWWIEAGVDTAVGEAPRDWRAPRRSPENPVELTAEPTEEAATQSVPQTPSAPAGPLPQAGVERPDSLDAFHAWLAETADLPLFRAGAARALPHGPAGAEVMLVSGIPQSEDVEEGRPIGGAAYALTVRMLAAIGLAPEAAYVTALTCFSGTGTRFSASETDACRETILRQIALAAPKRLLLLGDAPAKLLIGQPMAQARGKLHRVGGVPAVVTFPPRHLLANPGHKALAWADLLLLMGEAR